MRLAPCIIAVHLGCLHEASQTCGNGSVCPPGQQCADTGGDQLCILVTCGNGRSDPGEACDDGNNRSGDRCPADCSPPCGNGVLDLDEICDDGNTVDGDGCSSNCRALDGIFFVSPSMVQFMATEGDELPASVTVTTRLEFRDSVMTGYPPDVPPASWLAITERPSTSVATFDLQVTDTSVVGLRSTSVRFTTDDEHGGRSFDLPVAYRLEPSALAVQATPATLAFATAAGGVTARPRRVNVTTSGAPASVLRVPSWLTVAALPSPAASPEFAVSVRSTSFPVGTALSDELVFATMNASGRLQRTAAVHASYRVVAASPEVQFVAPYLGIAGRGGTLRVRGRGFQIPDTPVIVRIGDIEIGPVAPDGDTQVTLSYPPLPEGRYPVTISDPPGFAPTGPELVVVTPPSFTYQAIDAPSSRQRIIYDAERQAIYALNVRDEQIEHFVHAGGRWSARAPHAVPQIRDIVMVPNGRSLIVLDPDAINEISLTDGSFALVRRADNPFFNAFFSTAAAANNGKIFVVPAESCCPHFFEETLLYDIRDHSLVGGRCTITNGGRAESSEDGSRIYLSDNGIDGGNPVQIFDSLSNTTHPSTAALDLFGVSISRDASRVILSGADVFDGPPRANVYDRSLTLTGYLPLHSFLASRDATRAFVYVEDTQGARLEVYDLNGPLQPGGLYPLLRTVMLPDPANGGGQDSGATMTGSLDDSTVFISGSRKLLVVPVNGD